MSCASLGLPLEFFNSVEFSLHDGEHILSLCAYFWLIVCFFFNVFIHANIVIEYWLINYPYWIASQFIKIGG